jgi:ligand-binding SRPBCC domain-containing protein
MRIHTLRREQDLDGTPDEVFPFFSDAQNLEAITPPLLHFRVITPAPIQMQAGALIQYRLRLHGIPVSWKTLIQDWTPNRRFVDTQLSGPYALWHHTHTFDPLPGERTLMTDTIRYAIGFGPLGAIAHRALVQRDLQAIFDYRREAIVPLLRRSVTSSELPRDRRTRG